VATVSLHGFCLYLYVVFTIKYFFLKRVSDALKHSRFDGFNFMLIFSLIVGGDTMGIVSESDLVLPLVSSSVAQIFF
jgi:hypothetical protein